MNLTATGQSASSNDTESTKILIVDDVPQNLVAMEALLQRDGIRRTVRRVRCAGAGTAARA